MSRNMRTVLVVALLISLAGAALVYAERGDRRFGDQLTEEQREAVHAKVLEMRQAGASHEDVHAAVREMLGGYGITLPERRPEDRPGGRGHGRRFGDQLSEEQREAVHAKVREMREAGASREEIHGAIREMLASYGITLPEGRREGPREGRGPGGRFGEQLTEEQREAVHAKVREMRDAGASREEIHAAVRDMFAGFGIDLPDCAEAGEASSPTGNLGDSPGKGKKWGEIKGIFE
jgi:DNA-binding transcriptional regulator YhcF (GntR family)